VPGGVEPAAQRAPFCLHQPDKRLGRMSSIGDISRPAQRALCGEIVLAVAAHDG
jgi:hypothetical protein